MRIFKCMNLEFLSGPSQFRHSVAVSVHLEHILGGGFGSLSFNPALIPGYRAAGIIAPFPLLGLVSFTFLSLSPLVCLLSLQTAPPSVRYGCT